MGDYSEKTAKLDRIQLGREKDGRYTLTPEKEEELKADIATGQFSNSQLARAYGVSVTKVWNLANPEKYEENKRKRRENYDNKDYYNKSKLAEIKRNNRKKKREIMENEKDDWKMDIKLPKEKPYLFY